MTAGTHGEDAAREEADPDGCQLAWVAEAYMQAMSIRAGPEEDCDGLAGDGDCDDGVLGFETQVLHPLRDWLAVPVPTPRTAAAENAARFSLSCEPNGEDEEEEHAMDPASLVDGNARLPTAAAGSTAPLGLLEEQDSSAAIEDCLGLLEYDLLDYMDQLPEGLICKLRGNLQMHNEYVQQLCKRREILEAKARARRRDNPRQVGAAARTRAAAVLTAQDEWRRELRSQMAGRILAAQEARLRLAAEAHEAAMRAKLEHTRRAAQERASAMAKRAAAEEEEVKNRTAAAKLERERVRRHFETTKRELERSRSQVAEVDAEIKAAEAQARTLEGAKRPRVKEAEALRSELKAHRARATRHQNTEQRVKDLHRELEIVHKALGGTATEMDGVDCRH